MKQAWRLSGAVATTNVANGSLMAPRELVVGGQFLTRLLDPQATGPGIDILPLRHVYDTLVTFRPPNYNTYLPSLAKSWDISSNATLYTFNLRDDVKFYPSGNKMTADDIVWSFDRALKGQFPGCKAYNYVKEVRKIDDNTVQVELLKPFIAYLGLASGLYDGAIMDSKAMIPHVNGAWATPECDWGSPWINENSAGTGPYYLREWKRNERVVLERNPSYWGSKPANDKITFQIVAESAALQLLLERGAIDIAHTGIPLDAINDYIEKPRADVEVAQAPIFLCAVSHMNPAFKPFSEVKVRQAMRAAINYPEIIRKLLHGRALPLSSPLYKGLLGGGKTYYEYDLDKAKQLMSESKYPNGFEVTKLIPSSTDIGICFRDLALRESEDLAKIGIKVKIEEYDWGVLDERINNVKYDWAQDKYTIIFVDPEGVLTLGGAPRHGTSVIINKNFLWRDEEIDALCDKALSENDATMREQLYDHVCSLIAERGVNIWYFQMMGLVPHRANVKNFELWTYPEVTDYSNVTRSR